MAEEQDNTANRTLVDYCLNLFDRMSEKLASTLESKINDINLNLTTKEKVSVARVYRNWVNRLHNDKNLGLLINSIVQKDGQKFEKSKCNPLRMFKESAETENTMINDLYAGVLSKSSASFGAYIIDKMYNVLNQLENDRVLVHDLIVSSLTKIGYSFGTHILKKMQDNFSQLEIPGFDIEPIYLPMANNSNYVSGDTIIYFEIQNKNTLEHCISLVDVSGKDGAVKDALDAKAYFLLYHTPHKEVKDLYFELNNIFCERFKYDFKLYSADRFVSAESLFLPEVTEGNAPVTIKAIAAGNETLIYNRDKETFWTTPQIQDKDHIMGVFPNTEYNEHAMQISCGDILLLYSDGLTETRNEKGECFEMNRVKEIIKLNQNNSSHDIARELKDAVIAFANGNRSDDISFIVIKYTGLS